MIGFGEKTYPDTIETIVRDKALLGVFQDFLKGVMADENINMYLAPHEPEVVYERFIREGSAEQVNVPGGLFATANALAGQAEEDPQYWQHPDWVDILESFRSMCAKNLTNDKLSQFWRSKQFKKHHVANGGKPEDLSSPRNNLEDPTAPPLWQQAAEHFQFKNAKVMQAYITAFERHGADRTRTVAVKLLKAEGSKLTPNIFNKVLVKYGFAKGPASSDTKNKKPKLVDDGIAVKDWQKKMWANGSFTIAVKQFIEAKLQGDKQKMVSALDTAQSIAAVTVDKGITKKMVATEIAAYAKRKAQAEKPQKNEAIDAAAQGDTPVQADGGTRPELDISLVPKVDWQTFVKLHDIDNEDTEDLKAIAQVLIKKGEDHALMSSKKLHQKLKKQKSKSKFQSASHILGAIRDTMIRKKDGKKPRKVSKAPEAADG
ncbi:hypothetical protein [uncultured Tateyamaria sp.]|uniref:hypothetical protein n=1 Tax=uncultured Tateyamaria sp. TaxID=455651 RepID=UPI002622EE22|nr:hypothetical protein [uncultured Tateyamaria sp.]